MIMQFIFPFLLFVLFIFAILLLFIGVAKYAVFIYQNNNKDNELSKTFNFLFLTKLGNNLTFLKVLMVALLIAVFIIGIRVLIQT
jgi:hypothetical protein